MKNKYISFYSLSAIMLLALSCKRPAPKQQSTVDLKTAKTLFEGSWFNVDNPSMAEFFVQGDSIGSPDDLTKVKYLLKKDTIDLVTTNLYYKEVILKLDSDSLIVRELPSKKIIRYY